MNSVSKLIASLGKLSNKNEDMFVELFDKLPVILNLEEAESLIDVFDDNDEDDHCGLVWDFILKIETTPNLEQSIHIREATSYWGRMVASNLQLSK